MRGQELQQSDKKVAIKKKYEQRFITRLKRYTAVNLK